MAEEARSNRAVRQTVVPVGPSPFDGDLFSRKRLAERLTNSIGSFKEGGAIALDGAWGSGKTWFARNWRLDLEQQGYDTMYIDAFALDYVDDPFLMIAGELLSVAQKRKPRVRSALLKASTRLGKAVIPIGIQVVAGATTKLIGEEAALGSGQVLLEAVKGAGAAAEKYVAKKFAEYEKEKEAAAEYRRLLTELASTSVNPIVVFIDELDRCRPDFAVKTIERIKHFFEVPGVVFVLLVNRAQLCESIKGAYGQGLDADAYLRKFVLYSVELPKQREENYDNFNVVYCRQVLEAFGIPDNKQGANFAENFGALAGALNFEFRDVERGVALYTLAGNVNNSSPMVAWAIALKIWKPALFARLLRGERSAHEEVVRLSNDGAFGKSYIVPHALSLHRAHASGFTEEKVGDSAGHIDRMFPNARLERVFKLVFARIDLAVD